MEKYKKLIILFSILAVGIITISVIFALKDDQSQTGNLKDKNKNDPEVDQVELKGKMMMVTDIDLDSSSIRVMELDTGEEHSLIFTGGSDIRTKNMRVISAAYLKKGNIALVDFDENNRLISLIGSDKVWSYKNIRKLKIDRELGRIELGGNIYRLGSCYKVLNDDSFVSIDSLAMNGIDMIDLYGIDNNICLIKVVSGHGYLTLSNYDDFLDGNIYYGMGKCETVIEELRIMLPEGEQEITVQNDGQTATAIVRINNNEETCFDLEEYGPETVETKTVTFYISPPGSLLYIDGVKTSYAEPVSLAPGFHQIEVELGGYNSYKGSIEVEKDGMVKSISLSPQPTDIPDDILYDNFNETDNEDESGSDEGNQIEPGATPTAYPTATLAPDDADLSEYNETDIPDNTSVGTDDGDIEVIDGDKTGNDQASDSSNISIVGNNNDDDDEDEPVVTRDAKRYSGDMTIYCSEGTEVYIDDVYKGRISNGSLTTPKPVGTIELKLVKKGYVSKRYVLTMDEEEDSSIFKFPEMTPES